MTVVGCQKFRLSFRHPASYLVAALAWMCLRDNKIRPQAWEIKRLGCMPGPGKNLRPPSTNQTGCLQDRCLLSGSQLWIPVRFCRPYGIIYACSARAPSLSKVVVDDCSSDPILSHSQGCEQSFFGVVSFQESTQQLDSGSDTVAQKIFVPLYQVTASTRYGTWVTLHYIVGEKTLQINW